jgi:AbrB family looped-hinge helix DNA binding protein
MTKAIIRKRGTLVIPALLRERYGLDDGTAVEIEETGDGLLVRSLAPASAAANDEFWKQVDSDFARLREDPVAWAEYKAEFDQFDAAFAELPGEPPYSDD